MSFIKKLILSALISTPALAQQNSIIENLVDQKPSPNVILIVADDMAYGDFSYYGNRWINTPHFDALAANSLRWENFYVNPVGPLTRASTFTGRYYIRTKSIDTNLGRSMMATDEVTLAEALNGAGYKTGIFGKWHLGDHYPMRPSDQGFGTSLIHRGGGLGQPSDPIENKGHYTNPILFRNNQEVQSKGYCTDVFFNAAKEFITKSKSSQQPFFAAITVNVPHSPFSDVPSDLLAKYQKKDLSEWGEEPQKLARIAAMLENLDANVGLLTGLLKKENLLNNTIIIFMNDNGVNTTRFNKGLRGKKGQVYEGGVRSPLWIHWPDKVKKGRDMIDHSTAHIDIMPTVLDLCGLGVPDAFGFDGVSLAESILKLEPEGTIKALDRPIIMQWHRGATPIERRHFMVRKGDWKLLNPSKSSSKKENLELYNLAKDPFEENNLVASNEKIVDALLADYDRWFRDVTETRARDLGIPYILVNKEKENPLVLTWQERISKDWAYNEPGFWKLQFEHEGRCDIRVEFPTTFDRDLSGWTVQLSIGRETYKKTLFNRSSHYTFLALNFQKGKHLLKCSFTSPDGKETISAYQMRLLHR